MHTRIHKKGYINRIILLIGLIGIFLYVRQPLVYVFANIPLLNMNNKENISEAKNIIRTYIKGLEFIDKDGSKKNNLKEELCMLKKYILGQENAREIIKIQLCGGTNLNLGGNFKDTETMVKTNVEGASSISCNNETDNKELELSKTLKSGRITIANETNYKIDIEKLRKEPLAKKFNKDSKILIYHTHTNESYLSDIKDLKNMGIPSRSSNENINVIRVGKELKNNLLEQNLGVVHDTKYHNLPSDRGAYAKSYNTVQEHLKKEPNIGITLDIHRDGISDKKKLRIVTNVSNKNMAKIMFVVGTNSTGLKHDNWKENLKFALKLQEKLAQYDESIVKPIFISKNRYNQNLTNASLIVEIGGDGNTIDESIESAKFLSRAITEVVNDNLVK